MNVGGVKRTEFKIEEWYDSITDRVRTGRREQRSGTCTTREEGRTGEGRCKPDRVRNRWSRGNP